MQNHNDDTIKTSDTVLLKNILLTLFERVRKGYKRFYCVRGELEAEQNCNILTTTLMAITALPSRSPGLLKQGPGGPASLGHVPHSSIFSPISHSIQPVHGQGYILIFFDRMHLLFPQVYFLF